MLDPPSRSFPPRLAYNLYTFLSTCPPFRSPETHKSSRASLLQSAASSPQSSPCAQSHMVPLCVFSPDTRSGASSSRFRRDGSKRPRYRYGQTGTHVSSGVGQAQSAGIPQTALWQSCLRRRQLSMDWDKLSMRCVCVFGKRTEYAYRSMMAAREDVNIMVPELRLRIWGRTMRHNSTGERTLISIEYHQSSASVR